MACLHRELRDEELRVVGTHSSHSLPAKEQQTWREGTGQRTETSSFQTQRKMGRQMHGALTGGEGVSGRSGGCHAGSSVSPPG